MKYSGHVEHGVVVLSGGVSLPEGTKVIVKPKPLPRRRSKKKSIGQKLYELALEAEKHPCELPEDLAENHDYYLRLYRNHGSR